MAGRMRKWAGAAIVALAMMTLAGQAMALTTTRTAGAPLGGPTRWAEVWRMQTTAGVTLLGPSGTLLTLRTRTIGAYGRVGWGDYRMATPAR